MSEPRDFLEVLTEIRGGSCHHELSVALQDATKAAMETGKAGSVGVTIKIKPQGSIQVELVDTIKKSIPEPNKPSTYMFVDESNNLSRNDQRQMELQEVIEKKKNVVELDDHKQELKEVSA